MPNPEPFGRAKYLKSQTLLHDAWDLRPSVYGVPPGPGVAGYQDMRVMQRQAGANMSVDVGVTGVGLMTAWVRGTSRGGQGLYECSNIDWAAPTADTYLTQRNVTVTANASGNPRLDIIVLEILDAQHVGASNTCQLRCIAGTATAGATLDNRTNAPAIPASSILLADILVPNGAASILTADIRDRRDFPLWGVVPPLLTDVDQVELIPHRGCSTDRGANIDHASHDTNQSVALMFLPRRIVGATRIRWKFLQSATAITGNYTFGIYDASGRRIVDTGTVAWTGAANSFNVRSETISATTLESGWYYILFGLDSAAAGTAIVNAVRVMLDAASLSVGSISANSTLFSGTGGVTLPQTILGFTDMGARAVATNVVAVPLISLSVG